jgi:hypothetical protein
MSVCVGCPISDPFARHEARTTTGYHEGSLCRPYWWIVVGLAAAYWRRFSSTVRGDFHLVCGRSVAAVSSGLYYQLEKERGV